MKNLQNRVTHLPVTFNEQAQSKRGNEAIIQIMNKILLKTTQCFMTDFKLPQTVRNSNIAAKRLAAISDIQLSNTWCTKIYNIKMMKISQDINSLA